MIWLFALPAVAEVLAEHAIFVAQTVAHAGNSQCRHRIEETCGKAAQTAIAETRILFLFDDLERIELKVFAQFLPGWINHEVAEVVRQRPSEQKFHGEIIDALDVALVVGLT